MNIFCVQKRREKLALQDRDKKLRDQLKAELNQLTFADQNMSHSFMEPHDANNSASFFEPLWMFDRSLSEGFDIIFGNPPYRQIQKFPATQKTVWSLQGYETYSPSADIYCLFFEHGIHLLKPRGILAYITSNKYFLSDYGGSVRALLGQQKILSIINFGEVKCCR